MIKHSADPIAAHELALCTVNDGTVYRQCTSPVIRNLARKMAKDAYRARFAQPGSFDPALAAKAWRHVADHAARAYCATYMMEPKPYGGLSVSTRELAAVEIAEHYAEQLEETATALEDARVSRDLWPMSEIARANTDGGHNFFSPGTKRYFGDGPSYFRPVYIGAKIYFDRIRAANHAPAGYPVDELHEFNPADGSIGLPIRGADRAAILSGEV